MSAGFREAAVQKLMRERGLVYTEACAELGRRGARRRAERKERTRQREAKRAERHFWWEDQS